MNIGVKTGTEIGIYVAGELIAKSKSLPFDCEPIIDILGESRTVEMNFEGLFIADTDPNKMEIEYTVRRKGKVYFKAINHPYVNSLWVDTPGTYDLFKGIKKGQRFTGSITEIMQ